MKTFKTEYHHVIEGSDYQGNFQIRVHKDLSQIQVENDMDGEFSGNDIAIDVNIEELKEIRDFLISILEGK